MVRFSCFIGHTNSPKPKKALQPSFEAYHKTMQDSFREHISEEFPDKTSTMLLNSQGDALVGDAVKHVSSGDNGWKNSEEMKNKFVMEGELVPRNGQLKKSQSLGSGLYQKGRVSELDDIDDETDMGFSCDDSNEHIGIGIRDGKIDGGPAHQDQKALIFDSLQENSAIINDDSIFSIGEDQSHSEKAHRENSYTPVSAERGAVFSDQSRHTPRGIVKSYSLPNVGDTISMPISGGCARLGTRSRSLEDLHVPSRRWKDDSILEMEKGSVKGRVEDESMDKVENAGFEIYGDDNYDSCHYSSLAKDWVVPAVEKVETGKKVEEESLVCQWVELPNRDFKIKRIEEWVNDLQHCGPLEETDELFLDCVGDYVKGDSTIASGFAATAKVEDKVSPGMEAAKRYISSLSASAATAQLANHGLIVIPFLSAFVSLRVLNMSGNAIVRITAGALPRGLHTLNLSKNNIANIEGLRELTRLRILDLSYNRILRIGHGLASCSSLKELYLAGNKISEVEGLHRLLKLTVLDLRFNKISTAKCLGQLAANYNYLQAISLEGNPAQKNVGDDQLKKYLQGLLPHLAYYNRQIIKVSTSKDSSERSVRMGMSSHQFERGARPSHKATRKGSHVLTAQKPLSSSAHGRSSQAVAPPKSSKGRHGRLPPMGTKTTATTSSNNRNHRLEVGSRIMNIGQEFSTMRRSRSEGTLGAL